MLSARSLVAVAILVIAGCGPAPVPTSPVPSGVVPNQTTAPSDAFGGPGPSATIGDPLGGPWRATPIVVDDAHVAIASDACAAKARVDLGETDANLPTAVVDARGESLVTVIMADDLNAIECLARFDTTGTSATVDSVAGLSVTTLDPVDGSAITVSSVVRQSDRSGGRTVAFGRIGPDPTAARIGLPDGSAVVASTAQGWWAAWWPGAVLAKTYAAVDDHDVAIGHVAAPAGDVEARVGPASWWVDQTLSAPTATSTTIHAQVVEKACASGMSPAGRIEPPRIEPDDKGITVTFWVRRLPGPQDCQGNDPFGLDFSLPEPLGDRLLYDGSETPPRDVTKGPPG